jgi:hypothetical protein
MMVCKRRSAREVSFHERSLTVFPDPFQPTMRVSGAVNVIFWASLMPKDRMLQGSALHVCYQENNLPQNLELLYLG